MKRKISAKFKKARSEMLQKKTKCRECENYATELHHIIAVEDGGTDDIDNLMPLCKECHSEYTREQTEERNKMWLDLNIGENMGLTVQCKGEQESVSLGKVISEEAQTANSKIHYEYQWIVTVEIPATTAHESKEKLEKFRTELINRYAVTNDVWLTGIRRWDGNS